MATCTLANGWAMWRLQDEQCERGPALALTALWTGRDGEASGHAPANKGAAGLGAQRSPRSKDNT